MIHLLENISSHLLPLFVMIMVIYGLINKVPIYHSFMKGGREGVTIIVEILPSLVAMILAIEILQVSGTIDYFLQLLDPLLSLLHIPRDLLPLAIMRSLSGSGAQALLMQIFTLHGPDSYLGRVSSVLFGSTETTFYILTIYFGAVHIKDIRHALIAGLFADTAGFIGAIVITTFLLGSL